MIKVYIPNYSPQNNYNPAKKHGELVFMTRGVLIDSPKELHEKFASYFADANENDYLMFSGSHLACAIAYSEWTKRFPECRNLMVFNKSREDYSMYSVAENK